MMKEENRRPDDVEAKIERLKMEIQMEQEKMRYEAMRRTIIPKFIGPACIPFTPGQGTDKDRERERIEALKGILRDAEKELDKCQWWEMQTYHQKMIDLKKTIDSETISEMEKVEKFRNGLYRRTAFALALVFGGMALVSGLFGAVNLIVSINQGIVNALGALAWTLATVGLTFASVIAMAAEDVI